MKGTRRRYRKLPRSRLSPHARPRITRRAPRPLQVWQESEGMQPHAVASATLVLAAVIAGATIAEQIGFFFLGFLLGLTVALAYVLPRILRSLK